MNAMSIQGDLFSGAADTGGATVPGFALVEEAITASEEAELIARIVASPLRPFRFGQWTGRRLTCSYGKGYDFVRGRPAEAPPLPTWLADLSRRLAPLAGLDPRAIAQALLIRYDPGAGIGWHRDRPHYGEVLGLSLGAPANLRLRRRIPEGFERRSVHLAPRSLYRLSGEARQDWQHSIAPMAVPRWSVTLRTLR